MSKNQFNSYNDLKLFGRSLADKLEASGEIGLANELKEWSQTFYMPSEFLGELRIILYKAELIKTLYSHILEDVRECIWVIDEAFRKVNS